jgi:hypothetical protein
MENGRVAKKDVDGEWPCGGKGGAWWSDVSGMSLFSCCGPVNMAGERSQPIKSWP